MKGSMRVRSRPRAVSVEQQVLVLLVGIVVGLVAGYVLMGTAHAIFEIGADSTNAHVIRATAGRASTQAHHTTVKGNHPAGSIHTLVTGNGSPYQNIQLRIMYGTYKLVQNMPGGDKLTGFTRILHRSTDDEVPNLMNEIPTYRVKPLHPECDKWCPFPVADRPNAVMQFLDAAEADPSLIRGQWLLLLESDYVWMKPLPAPDATSPSAQGMMYLFDYITPNHPLCREIIRRLSGGLDPESIPRSGPAPVLLRFSEWRVVGPLWEQLTATIENDEPAKKVLDWVREMYAWDIAVAQSGIKFEIAMHPHSKLIAQPPHDHKLGQASLYHYTWGTVYKEGSRQVWQFDKRTYTSEQDAMRLPRLTLPPEWRPGLQLQDGLPVTKELHEAVYDMLQQMNRAVEAADVIHPA